MTTVIVGMLVALLLAVGVVALVAVPAHREGRDLLSPEGEQRVQNARGRVVDLAERLPSANRDGGSSQTPGTSSQTSGTSSQTSGTSSHRVD